MSDNDRMSDSDNNMDENDQSEIQMGDEVPTSRLLPLLEDGGDGNQPIFPQLNDCKRGGGRPKNTGSKPGVGCGCGPGLGGDGSDGDDGAGPGGDGVDPKLRFSSVGVQDKHVEFLKRAIIFPLKKPDEFKAWGIEPPKGVLFHGPPGTGKTLLAKALCNELNVAMGDKKVVFFYKKGSETNSEWFGESEKNLRDLFSQAQAAAPSVIFFDEIDGLCPNRDTAARSSQPYAGVVTAMLGLIDSVKRGQVLIIAATNRLDAIDPAIRRPGRFDKSMEFNLPDEEGRKRILIIHTTKWKKCKPEGEFLDRLAKRTQGCSGADLEKLTKDAVWKAQTRHGHPLNTLEVKEEDWEAAVGDLNISPTEVFGSSVFVPSSIPEFTRPLIQETVNEVSTKLADWIPTRQSPEEFPSPMMAPRSLLIYHESEAAASFLHRVVMNAVFASPTLDNLPLHLLSFEKISAHNNPFGRAQKIVTIVKENREPCLLYVPKLDEVMAFFQRPEYQGTNPLATLLLSLRGSNCFLLATMVGQPNLAALRNGTGGLLFSEKVTVQHPSPDDRKTFFQPPFDGLILPAGKRGKTAAMLTKEQSESFQKLWDKAVKISGERDPDSMMNLYIHLMRAKSEDSFTYANLEAEYSRLIDLFAKTNSD